MEIHFYESESDMPFDMNLPMNGIRVSGWTETCEAIEHRIECIYTTQMGLLQTTLIEKWYRIFVHPYCDKPYEIKIGSNDCTEKDIRMAHNIFKMWKAGEFFNGN